MCIVLIQLSNGNSLCHDFFILKLGDIILSYLTFLTIEGTLNWLKQTYMSGYACCCSAIRSCMNLCDPMACGTRGFPVLHYLPEFAWVSDAISPSLRCPLLFLPSIFPSIGVFSNESALHIKWSTYWSFSSIISPSNEYSGLISFRMDWLDLLVL